MDVDSFDHSNKGSIDDQQNVCSKVYNHVSPAINIHYLSDLLVNHPDRVFVQNHISGLNAGFHVGLNVIPSVTYEWINALSARKDPKSVEAFLQSEVDKGYMIGPFAEPHDCYRTSPLGLAERKYSSKKQLILDLSAPHDNEEVASLNGLINKEEYSLSYVKIDDAIRIIKSLGPGAWLCKRDMVDAFKQITIHPSLWPFYGAKWHDKYYFDTRLAFDSRSSPKIFNWLSSAITRILQN